MMGWRELNEELDRWPDGQAGFWWRDDDAGAPSPALARLLCLGPQPVAVAAIPARAEVSLVPLLQDPRIDVLQHGFNHVNHEPEGRKKAELGPGRPADTVIGELEQGRRRLEQLFGARFLPVLVPPWNRVEEGVVVRLAEAGLFGLSVYGPRPMARRRPLQVNTHVDILDWRNGGRFLGPAAVLKLAISHLAARRKGEADREEPTGLLTHHARMDEASFAFVAEFLTRLAAHRAVHWLSARDIFAARSP